MAKKEINLEQFRAIIKEEAMKLKKRALLENEKKSLQAELKGLLGESCAEEGEMEEGRIGDFLGTSPKAKEEKMKNEFLKFAKIWKQKGAIRGLNQEMLDDLMSQAAADNFEGKPGLDKANKLMTYRAADDINWSGLGLNKGGSFGGTGAGAGE